MSVKGELELIAAVWALAATSFNRVHYLMDERGKSKGEREGRRCAS